MVGWQTACRGRDAVALYVHQGLLHVDRHSSTGVHNMHWNTNENMPTHPADS